MHGGWSRGGRTQRGQAMVDFLDTHQALGSPGVGVEKGNGGTTLPIKGRPGRCTESGERMSRAGEFRIEVKTLG